VVKEVNDHIETHNWELIPREDIPKGIAVLPSVWSMKCKQDIKNQQVYKDKARLNVHGGKQVYGKNYFKECIPVVTWFSIHLVLILSIINKWHTRQKESSQPKVYCKAFKDNTGALKLARLPKMRPQTKHVNIKYHHFREYIHFGLIKVLPISTTEQIADIFTTKPLAQNAFLHLRKALLHY
jgi:hypothetical protein